MAGERAGQRRGNKAQKPPPPFFTSGPLHQPVSRQKPSSGTPQTQLAVGFLNAFGKALLKNQSRVPCSVNSAHLFNFGSSATFSRKLPGSISQEQKSVPPLHSSTIQTFPFAMLDGEGLEGGDRLRPW